MNALKANGNTVAIVAGILGGVAILTVAIVALVLSNRSKSDAPAPAPAPAPSPAPASFAPVSSPARVHFAPTGEPLRAPKPAVRAAVLGSMPQGYAGAPYKSATATRTTGPSFPQRRHSEQGAQARQSASGLGGSYALTGNKALFNRTPDELDAHDIDVADAFPVHSDEPPKNGHEAIAAMYSYHNFRAALDKDNFGYLAPVFDRQGWSKLGDRNPCLWNETMQAVRDSFPKDMTLEQLFDGQMVPISDQFFDFMYEAAEKRDVRDIQTGYGGMGGRAAGSLYEKLDREWREGKPAHRHQRGDQAQIIRDAIQEIPTNNTQAAKTAIREIMTARQMAREDGINLPELSSSQLSALAIVNANNEAVHPDVLALCNQERLPLPPAGY
jgi:hypothetical protein